MPITITVHRHHCDDVYFAWKCACNAVYRESTHVYPENEWSRETMFDVIERKYGCKTVEVHKHKEGYTHSVTLEFESEATMAWFILQWTR